MTYQEDPTAITSLSRPGRLVLGQWWRVVPTILIGLFLAELSVMLLLERLGLQGGLLTALLDALLLTVLILPGLYVLVLLPLAKLASQLAAASANARFRAVVEAAGDAILICDGGGRIVFANRAASEVFDYGREEMVGAEVTKLIPEDRWERHTGGFRSYLASDRSRENGAAPREVVGRRRNGSLIPLEINLSASRVVGDGLILGVLRDLRSRKRMALYEALLPVCCLCGSIRDDTGVGHGQGAWTTLDRYVQARASVQFSRTFCPGCMSEHLRSSGMPAGAGHHPVLASS